MFNRLLNTPLTILSAISRSSRPEAFLRKDVLKICSKFTEKHPCRSVILIKLQSNFIEITLRLGSSPVNLLHIFQYTFLYEHLWRVGSINILVKEAYSHQANFIFTKHLEVKETVS